MASGYLESIPLPPALPAILDKLVKAVLRDQPKDIIQYCADYFSSLEGSEIRAKKPNIIDSSVKKAVEDSFRRYYPTVPERLKKEDVLKFMRFHASESKVEREPIPNSI